MSIKIWHGFRIESDCIQYVCDKARTIATEVRYSQIEKALGTGYFDENFFQVARLLKELHGSPSLVLFIDGNQWYGICFCDNETKERLFAELPIVDFHYQDQTDRDEEISDEEWQHRRETWDRLLLSKGAGVPSDHGFIVNLIPQQMMPRTS